MEYEQKGCNFATVSNIRPAPSELPQGGNTARVGGCSGAICLLTFYLTFFSLLQFKTLSMQFFIDTANLDQIKEAQELGILDGVTTNPSLMAKEGIKGEDNILKHYKKICEIVDGPVSAEVISTDFEGMIREGKILSEIDENIVVKVPMIKEGIRAISWFTEHEIETNCTLVFSAGQAILAAKAGATYVSPFIGRIDDMSMDGMLLIEEIAEIYAIQGFETLILAASIRNPLHIVNAAKKGADIVTCPLNSILGLLKHPLTDIGLAQFLADHQKSNQ